MAAFDRTEANKAMLQQTEDTQRLTKEAVGRIKNQIGETEVIANATLEQLREQGAQMDHINMEVVSVQQKLDTASRLQDSFDNWSGSWFGGKKRAATKEAAEISAQRVAEELINITEVFENQKFDRVRRIWKQKPMTLCSDPTVYANDPFDPKEQLASATSRWAIDFSLVGIDSEGWTYAYDFPTLNKSGAGVPASAWNTFVRRRKWRLVGRGANSVVEGYGAISHIWKVHIC
jgi:Asp-tRNA(Asn)/Glu-tRNA(Gln) amidotransferase A subunit family amidase